MAIPLVLILPLLLWLIQQNISLTAKEIRLNSLEQDLTELKKENKTLKEQLAKYTDKDKFLSKYTFDSTCGVYVNKSYTLFYCPKCLLERNIESPLHETSQYLSCPVCNASYSKPEDYINLKQMQENQKDNK